MFIKRATVALSVWLLTSVTLFYTFTAEANERPALPALLQGYEVKQGFEWFPSKANLLFFVGSIYEGQEEVLKEFLEKHPEIDTIVLHSGGGLVSEAAMMSRIIFEREMTTYVPRDATCASACGYMWLAGKVRVLDGTLGAHRISVDHEVGAEMMTTADAYEHMQKMVASLMIWMYEYEVPVLYYAWMFHTPSEEMHDFSDAEEAELVRGQDGPQYDHIDNFVSLKYNYLRALMAWRESNVPTTTTTDTSTAN
jgi:hypothetical protein